MKVFLFLKKGFLELAKAEAGSLADEIILEGKDFVIGEFKDHSFKRLVLTRFSGELLAEVAMPEEFESELDSFAVRCTLLDGSEASKTQTERMFGKRINGSVNLDSPETVIRVFAGKESFFVTRQLHEYSEKDFSCRKVNARPYHHPTSLQPWWARLLINLSGLKRGVLLDPFCGAGGIVLEAGVIGLNSVGVDKDEATVEGARENLWFFRVDDKCKIEQADFLSWNGGCFNVIVSDLPYGKSSNLFGKKLHELYSQAFSKMRGHSSKAVLMGPEDLSVLLEESGWRVEQKFDFYVHRTLRRWIHVCDLNSCE